MLTAEEAQILRNIISNATFKGQNEARIVLTLDAKLVQIIEEANGDVSDSPEPSPESPE